MGIISIKSSDNLFWLGRYVERVFTTLKAFTECYDIMIDINDEEHLISVKVSDKLKKNRELKFI